MSLDFNVSEVKNFAELFDAEGKPGGLVSAATFMCMGIQLGDITEKNWQEWYRRAWVWEAIHGPMRTNGTETAYFTEEEVQRLIGLHTNVFPAMGKKAFMARMGEISLEQFTRKRAQERKEEEPR